MTVPPVSNGTDIIMPPSESVNYTPRTSFCWLCVFWVCEVASELKIKGVFDNVAHSAHLCDWQADVKLDTFDAMVDLSTTPAVACVVVQPQYSAAHHLCAIFDDRACRNYSSRSKQTKGCGEWNKGAHHLWRLIGVITTLITIASTFLTVLPRKLTNKLYRQIAHLFWRAHCSRENKPIFPVIDAVLNEIATTRLVIQKVFIFNKEG
jgi:hypothetical protein